MEKPGDICKSNYGFRVNGVKLVLDLNGGDLSTNSLANHYKLKRPDLFFH